MVNGYQPTSLQEALAILAQEAVTPYGGGTDLMINPDEQVQYLFLAKIPELKRIVQDNEYIRLGAACTFTDVLESKLAPTILKEAVSQIAAPAIRNLGTIGGNVCNGSPKADSALVFVATEAKLRLASSRGERVVPISEFYLGKKRTILQPNELLVEVLMKRTGLDHYYYKKVGARNALAISRVSFAGILAVEQGLVANCMTAFGAIGDVIFRRKEIDELLIGKTIAEARQVKEQYLAAYDQAIIPLSGRISAEYRKAVCMNLLKDFLISKGI